jgi:hypothetical protein
VFHVFSVTRRIAQLSLAASLVTLGGCSDHHDHEDLAVEFMRLTIGGQTVTVNARGQVSGGPVTIPAGVATSVTAEFLNASMAPEPAVNATDFQVSVTPNAGISFARTGAFTGTLTASSTGTIVVRFGLLHVTENHHDFGPFQVPVTVSQQAVTASSTHGD